MISILTKGTLLLAALLKVIISMSYQLLVQQNLVKARFLNMYATMKGYAGPFPGLCCSQKTTLMKALVPVSEVVVAVAR
jgi:hypothetical protein